MIFALLTDALSRETVARAWNRNHVSGVLGLENVRKRTFVTTGFFLSVMSRFLMFVEWIENISNETCGVEERKEEEAGGSELFKLLRRCYSGCCAQPRRIHRIPVNNKRQNSKTKDVSHRRRSK